MPIDVTWARAWVAIDFGLPQSKLAHVSSRRDAASTGVGAGLTTGYCLRPRRGGEAEEKPSR